MSLDEQVPDLKGTNKALAKRLRAPLLKQSVSQILERFEWSEIRLVCELPRNFEEVPDLPDRLRGALGRALERDKKMLPAWLERQPSAWSILFGETVNLGGEIVPRPFVIDTDVRGRDLVICLRLAGFASGYTSDIMDGLSEALASGVAIKGNARLRIPLSAHNANAVWRRTIPVRSGTVLDLSFQTPLVMRRQGRVVGGIGTLPMVIFRRLHGMSRWLDSDIQKPDERLIEGFCRLSVLREDLYIGEWPHSSSNWQSRNAPVRGILGRSCRQGDLACLAGLFEFAALFHAGSDSALGAGRISVSIY